MSQPVKPVSSTLERCQAQLKAASHDLHELATEHAKVLEALAATRNELQETMNEVGRLAEENQTLKKPPLGYALFVRHNEEDRTADIDVDGKPVRVGIHPALESADLKPGTPVLVTSSAILSIVDPRHIGRAMSIEKILDADTVIVRTDMEQKEIVRVADDVDRTQLESGVQVTVTGGFLTRIINEMGQQNALGSATAYTIAEMPDTTFDDIGGLDDEIAEILASLEDPHRVPEAYEQLELKQTFSLLLFGLPGNGKSSLAKAIARYFFDKYREQVLKYAKGNFIAVMGPELHHRLWGEAERKLREIGQGAQRLYELSGVPVTIFFDDCDSMFVSRGATEHFTPNMDMVNQFNSMVEGIRSFKGVNLIAATNRIDLMDAAVVSRFDKQKRINPPQTANAAADVLRKCLRGAAFENGKADETIVQFAKGIFAATQDNEILEIHFEDEDDTEIVPLSQMLSGRMLRDIVNTAKTITKDRVKMLPENQRVWALRSADLEKALERELRNKESLPTTKQQVREWLRQRGDKREVDDVINLREHRRMEEKRDRITDRRVQ